ncbi:3-hydroxyacyl-CoA dehydrogenase NAD-binding domain-containing protein [Schinkia sp. CFF1]
MGRTIRKAAVIGAGVMGSGIAAHLANIGIPTLLLDIVPSALNEAEIACGFTLDDMQVRNRLALAAKQKLLMQKPAPLMSKRHIDYIEAGNLTDHLEKLSKVDWIIEAVVEKLDSKQSIFEKIEQIRSAETIVSSNTSGISIEAMAEGRSAEFKKHFLGTHFFNPPRYLKLLEIIPTKYTDHHVLEFMKSLCEEVLGKGVVVAKDTPNFIANRIGTYGFFITVKEMLKGDYSVGEVDSLTGPLIGRPKSATFRTLDVVGLDTFLHVANNVYEKVSEEEQQVFAIPAFMRNMLNSGWLGSKSGQGFYLKKAKDIFELNVKTMQYQPMEKMKSASLERSKQAKDLSDKLKLLVYSEDRTGQFLWNILKPMLLYSARLVGVIADDLVAIDNAMKWGFGWKLGPFETWDVIGLEQSIRKMEREGEQIPTWIGELLASCRNSFYENHGGVTSFYDKGENKVLKQNYKVLQLSQEKQRRGVIKKNSGASLLDIGDDVACLEFHSPNQTIGLDIIQMIQYAVSEVEKNYRGLVIGHHGKNFCLGANLALILMEAQDDNFFEIEFVVRQFQNAMMRIKYCEKPVVVAPFAMTLGGGAEVSLSASGLQASSETYIGLVETGVGLIPGGGGSKELYIRQLAKRLSGARGSLDAQVGIDSYSLNKAARTAFETIAMAKVSTSAHEAKELDYLRPQDSISFNADHLLFEAKQKVLALDSEGYRPPHRHKIPIVGEVGYAAMLLGAQHMKTSGFISDHDLKIASKLAFVISGGRLAEGTFVDEQYLLDLEREAFLSLLGERKTQERMQHMLIKGKPLRN